MKLFDPSTWPENPTGEDRRRPWDMYAAHQKFKLKLTLVLLAAVALLHWLR